MQESIPPEHAEIHGYLTHWGRWVRSRASQGHCGSLEHRYRSPQRWESPTPRPEEINATCAVLVETCMRVVPKGSRKLLKFRYVYLADLEWITKRLRLPDYPQSLYTARQIVLNLTRHKLAPTVHGKFHNLSLSDYASRSVPMGTLTPLNI
jgi:hypothetical protein